MTTSIDFTAAMAETDVDARAALLRGSITPELRGQVVAMASRGAAMDVTTLAVRDGAGREITPAVRDELLAALAEHKYVELEIELLAYEQKTGEMNRNFVRFRDASMAKLGRSGRGTPMLRDHEQGDLTARAGTVISSKTESPIEGHYQVKQRARLTAPFAVEAALRGNLDRFSIGWNPTGDVTCSLHGTSIFTKCYCFPGDKLKLVTDEHSGEQRLRYAADGDLTAEWVFDGELVETSAVNVPAVPSAQIEGIRAALAAQGSRGMSPRDNDNRGDEPHEGSNMLKALATILGLGATATENDVTGAVEKQARDLKTAKAELAISEKARETLETEVSGHRATEAKTAEDKFIATARDERRIGEDEEDVWRTLHQANPTVAAEKIAKLAKGRVPPKAGLEVVLASKQRDQAPKTEVQADGYVISESQRKINRSLGMTDEQFIAGLKRGAAMKGGN